MHTLVILFSKPGAVPKDYIEGKRQRYLPPVRIYFISSILLLFLIQYAGKSDDLIELGENKADGNQLTTDRTETKDSVLLEFTEGSPQLSTITSNEETGKISRMTGYYSKTGEEDADKALIAIGLETTLLNRFLYSQSTKVAEFDDEEFSRYFASKLFWVLFLFLPILAGVHHLLYLRRKFYYPEHLFFTFYNQATFFLLLSLGFTLVRLTGKEGLIVIFILVFLVYQFLALLRFYAQGTSKTFLKFVILNTITLPLFGIFFIIAALITFIFF